MQLFSLSILHISSRTQAASRWGHPRRLSVVCVISDEPTFSFSHLPGRCWAATARCGSLRLKIRPSRIFACCRHDLPSSADTFGQKAGLANNIGTRRSAVNAPLISPLVTCVLARMLWAYANGSKSLAHQNPHSRALCTFPQNSWKMTAKTLQ